MKPSCLGPARVPLLLSLALCATGCEYTDRRAEAAKARAAPYADPPLPPGARPVPFRVLESGLGGGYRPEGYVYRSAEQWGGVVGPPFGGVDFAREMVVVAMPGPRAGDYVARASQPYLLRDTLVVPARGLLGGPGCPPYAPATTSAFVALAVPQYSGPVRFDLGWVVGPPCGER